MSMMITKIAEAIAEELFFRQPVNVKYRAGVKIEEMLRAMIKPLSFHERTKGTIRWMESASPFGPIRVYEKTWLVGDTRNGGLCEGIADGQRSARVWYEEQIEEIFIW
jgi:hypothetical protein